MKTRVSSNFKQICTSEKYKYVRKVLFGTTEQWQAAIAKYKFSKCFNNEKEAAIAVDKKFIENGKNPVNILKKIK